MKIVRKSSAQAIVSSNLDDGQGSPLRTPKRSADRQYTEESESSDFKSADFSHMTRQDLLDLIHCHVRSGQLSLDDGATLAWLSVNLPAEGNSDTVESDDHSAVNFMAGARRGADAANANGNTANANQYENAVDILRRIQGQTIGVDTLV